MFEIPYGRTARLPVILQDATGSFVNNIAAAGVTLSIMKASGQSMDITVSASEWTQLTGAAYSGRGYYNLLLSSTYIDVTGVMQYCIYNSSAQPYFGVVKVAYDTNLVYDRIGQPVSGTISNDIQNVPVAAASGGFTAQDRAWLSATFYTSSLLPADPASNSYLSGIVATSFGASDRADILTIKNKTNNLPSDPASNNVIYVGLTATSNVVDAYTLARVNEMKGTSWGASASLDKIYVHVSSTWLSGTRIADLSGARDYLAGASYNLTTDNLHTLKLAIDAGGGGGGTGGGSSYHWTIDEASLTDASIVSASAGLPRRIVPNTKYGSVVLADNPTVFYQFEELNGTVLYDSSPNNITGTILSASYSQPGLEGGTLGNAAGANWMAQMSRTASLEPHRTSSFSIEFWYYGTIYSTGVTTLLGANGQWWIFTNAGNVWLRVGGGAAYYDYGVTSLGTASQWNHHVITYNGAYAADSTKWYLNGNALTVNSTFAGTSEYSYTAPARILGDSQPNGTRIDNVAFYYGNVLPAASAAAHFSGGAAVSPMVTWSGSLGAIYDVNAVVAPKYGYGTSAPFSATISASMTAVVTANEYISGAFSSSLGEIVYVKVPLTTGQYIADVSGSGAAIVYNCGVSGAAGGFSIDDRAMLSATYAKVTPLPSDPAGNSYLSGVMTGVQGRIMGAGAFGGGTGSTIYEAVHAPNVGLNYIAGKAFYIPNSTVASQNDIVDIKGAGWSSTTDTLHTMSLMIQSQSFSASFTSADRAWLSATYVSSSIIYNTELQIKNKTDNLPNDPVSTAHIDPQLDAIFSASSVSGGFSVDDRNNILGIKAKTDNLPTQPADATVTFGTNDRTKLDQVYTKTAALPADPVSQAYVLLVSQSLETLIRNTSSSLGSGVSAVSASIQVVSASIQEVSSSVLSLSTKIGTPSTTVAEDIIDIGNQLGGIATNSSNAANYSQAASAAATTAATNSTTAAINTTTIISSQTAMDNKLGTPKSGTMSADINDIRDNISGGGGGGSGSVDLGPVLQILGTPNRTISDDLRQVGKIVQDVQKKVT